MALDDEIISPEKKEETAFNILPNVPNPFVDETFIRFELPEDRKVQIQIYDSQGLVLKTIEQDFQKGLNEVAVHQKDLLGGGIYFYKISSGRYSGIGKMLLH